MLCQEYELKEFIVSRWSDEFDKHPIHQLLNQANEHLEAEVEETDSEFQNERLRLTNVLGNLKTVLAGLDSEFFPKTLLDQIQQNLSHQHFLPQLQAYSNNPTLNNLQMANNHITASAPAIYQLASMSRQIESQEVIANAREAFNSFSTSMEAIAGDYDARFAQHETELGEFNQKFEELEENVSSLDTTTNEKLSEWQADFTAKQTARAEEHSKAQIERDTNFAENLKAQQSKFEAERIDTVKIQKARFNTEYDGFKLSADNANKEIKDDQAKIRTLHNLVSDETVTGGYHKSAKEEGKAANFWRLASIGCLIVTAIWLGLKIKSGFVPLENGAVNWPDVITASSLTAIFLYAAGYTSRQSKMHRDNETLLRSYALETQALDPFIASLASKEQQAIKAELVRRMFGQQNTNGTTEPTKLDDGTVKTLVDKFSDTVSDVVGKAVDKG